MKHYTNEKTTAVISYLERQGLVKEIIADIFQEIVAVLKDERRCKECFIMLSAIDQVPHDTEIADFINHDTARLEQAFYKALVRAQGQGELGDRQENLLSLAQ